MGEPNGRDMEARRSRKGPRQQRSKEKKSVCKVVMGGYCSYVVIPAPPCRLPGNSRREMPEFFFFSSFFFLWFFCW